MERYKDELLKHKIPDKEILNVSKNDWYPVVIDCRLGRYKLDWKLVRITW